MGARRGAAFGSYLLVVIWLGDRLEGPEDAIITNDAVPWCFSFVLGWAVGGAMLRGFKPAVDSVYTAMLLAMLCLVPALIGTGLLLSGWRGTALDPLVLTIPLGAMLGFVGWRRQNSGAR